MNLPQRQPKIVPVSRPQDSEDRRKPAPTADSLAESAARALQAGRSADAVRLLRDAVKLSPMRTDLREALSAALERRAGLDAEGRPTPTPIPVAGRPPRRSLLGERPMMPAEAPQIEEIRLRPDDRDEEIEGLESELPPPRPAPRVERRAPRAPAAETPLPAPSRRPAPRPALPRDRRRAAPRSRNALLFLSAFVGFALLAAGAIFLMAGGEDEETPVAKEKAAARAAAAEDQRLLAEADEDLKQNRYSLAIEKLERLSAGPDKEARLAKTFAKQGDDFARDKKYTEARQAYESALEHDPSNAALAIDLGRCFYVLGRKQQGSDQKIMKELLAKAERQFKMALEIDAASARALEGLALVESARGNSPGAAIHYRKIIELHPGTAEADAARRNLEMMRLKP